MSDPYRIDGPALDRWITGNYGEDQYRDEVDDELEYDEEELEEDIESMRACARPGRYGCGYCDACEEYGDMLYEAAMDDMRDI